MVYAYMDVCEGAMYKHPLMYVVWIPQGSAATLWGHLPQPRPKTLAHDELQTRFIDIQLKRE